MNLIIKDTRKHRPGYPKQSATVIMKNGSEYVHVKREDVLERLSRGWVTVPRSVFRKVKKETPEAIEVVVKKSVKRKEKVEKRKPVK